jgi:hypothetical protein
VFTTTAPGLYRSSASTQVPYVVFATATTTTLSVAPNPVTFPVPVIATVTVTPRTAQGTIRLYDGTTPLGAPVTVTVGTVTLTTPVLDVGTHTLTAVFTPANPTAFGPSTSPPVLLTVRPLI